MVNQIFAIKNIKKIKHTHTKVNIFSYFTYPRVIQIQFISQRDVRTNAYYIAKKHNRI